MSAVEAAKTTPSGPSPRSSAAPLLSENNQPDEDQSGLLAKGKRKLFSLGKKKEGKEADNKEDQPAANSNSRTMSPTSAPTLLPSPPLTTSPPDRRSSPRGSPRMYPAGIGASPNRRINRSSSPGLHSPASSQIFERNVQEPEPSPAIPAHIKIEDSIPPALDASSIAITDDHLNPDEVEIVMHSAHQPAATAVSGSVTDSVYSPSLALEESVLSQPDLAESASNSGYGSLDTTDVRRLSFISFADVVQAEHAETDRDAMQLINLSSAANRSPSPVRSPASSHGGFSASPPRSGAASEKGVGALSPGSPTAHGTHSPPPGGELQIETMRQALRRTGSGDLSGARSQPLSAVSLEDAAADQPPFK